MRSRGLTRAWFVLMVSGFAEIGALPPFIPLETRTREADVVIVGEVVEVLSHRTGETTRAAMIRVLVMEELKGRVGLPQLTVHFVVFPGSYENHLRSPPARGKYFLFLQKEEVKDAAGKAGMAFVLYRPHPFSFAPVTAENRSKVEAGLRGIK